MKIQGHRNTRAKINGFAKVGHTAGIEKREASEEEPYLRTYLLLERHSASAPALASREIDSVQFEKSENKGGGWTGEALQKVLAGEDYLGKVSNEGEDAFNQRVESIVRELVNATRGSFFAREEFHHELHLSELRTSNPSYRGAGEKSLADAATSLRNESQGGWLKFFLSLFGCGETFASTEIVPPRLASVPKYGTVFVVSDLEVLSRLSTRSLYNLKRAIRVMIARDLKHVSGEEVDCFRHLEANVRSALCVRLANYQLAKNYYMNVAAVLGYLRGNKKIYWTTLYHHMPLLRSVYEATQVMSQYEHVLEDKELRESREEVGRYLYNVFNAFLYPMNTFDIEDIRCLKQLCDEHDVSRRNLNKVSALGEELNRFAKGQRKAIGEIIDHRIQVLRNC